MKLNIKLAALIGASAVATAAAVYAAISIHNKKERDAKLKASEDLFKDFECDSKAGLTEGTDEIGNNFEKCKHCANVACPYCGVNIDTCCDPDPCDDWSAELELDSCDEFAGEEVSVGMDPDEYVDDELDEDDVEPSKKD